MLLLIVKYSLQCATEIINLIDTTISVLLSVVLLCCCVVLKKVKHRVVENMNSGTADALGLSRAILCNGQ